MNVRELLKAWEEGIVAATAPTLKRREKVSEADLSQHMHVLRIRTHLQTGHVYDTYVTVKRPNLPRVLPLPFCAGGSCQRITGTD
jgi:hypothetical protein